MEPVVRLSLCSFCEVGALTRPKTFEFQQYQGIQFVGKAKVEYITSLRINKSSRPGRTIYEPGNSEVAW